MSTCVDALSVLPVSPSLEVPASCDTLPLLFPESSLVRLQTSRVSPLHKHLYPRVPWFCSRHPRIVKQSLNFAQGKRTRSQAATRDARCLTLSSLQPNSGRNHHLLSSCRFTGMMDTVERAAAHGKVSPLPPFPATSGKTE